MSVFLAVCVRLSLHRGRGWEGEVSKWFLFCSCLVFSRSFVHDCKTAKCFPNQGEPKFGQIRSKSKAALKFDISRLCSQTFNCFSDYYSYLIYYYLIKASGLSRNSVPSCELFLTLSFSRNTSVLELSKYSFARVNKLKNVSWLSSSHASCDSNSLSSSINFVNSSCLTISVSYAS